MVGIDGHPQFFGNALDLYRRILFDNRSQAERVRAEFLGDPQNSSTQHAAGLYKAHVPESLRGNPHAWCGQHGRPVHSMLAEFCRHTVQLPPDLAVTDCPSSGTICVIVTVRTEQGDVKILVWQWQHYFALAEGMTFNLLDRMDGNVPAVVSGGVLRIDPSGILPDAPENIHRLWDQAEAAFFERYMYMDARLPQVYSDWDQRRLSDWWIQTRESQQQQQSDYRRRIARLGPQAIPPLLPQHTVLAQDSDLASRSREQVVEAPIEISSSSEASPPHIGRGSCSGMLATGTSPG